MNNVKVGKSVSMHDALWRYMSLDKFINLLDTETLYLTPLSSYENSDPFEGYPPKIVLVTLSKVLGKEHQNLEIAYQQLVAFAKERDPQSQNEQGQKQLSDLRAEMDSMEDQIRNSFRLIVKGVTVNCWHRNQHESEAMWKLYSESGKGIAIKTKVDSLIAAINSKPQNVLIQIGAVKYINFDDPDLELKDCSNDGALTPLLKRISFSHENEVRLFTVPNINHETTDSFQPKPELVQISVKELIEEIYISPFAGEPFISSAIAICKKYGIEEHKIKKSGLLDGHHELLAALTTSTHDIHN